MEKLVIATRGSRLALWQANHVKDSLEAAHPGLAVELNVIKTKGDIILDVPLAKVGGKGLFVKEIEEALLSGAADIAVHSMKDVPMELPEGLVLGIVPEREDPTDLFLSVKYESLEDLPAGAVVGTSSLRRQAQVLALRPDLKVESLRGNVDTRLRKAFGDEYDGAILAAAGLERMGESEKIACLIPCDVMVPAAGQGAVGVEIRADDEPTARLVALVSDEPTVRCVSAERFVLASLGGSCKVPMGVYAREEQGRLVMDAIVLSLDGSRIARSHCTAADGASPLELAQHMVDELVAQDARTILADILENEEL